MKNGVNGSFCLLIVALIALPGSKLPGEEVVLEVPSTSSFASVAVSAPLSVGSETSSTVSGQVVVDLLPTAVNPEFAQVKEIDLVIDEAVELTLSVLILGDITASAEAGALEFNLLEPGDASEVFDGEFSQLDNEVVFSGSIATPLAIAGNPINVELGRDTTAGRVDFDLLELTANRQTIGLGTSIDLPIVVPIEQINVSVTFDVAANILGAGAVPAAAYQWVRPDTFQSDFGFDDTQFWLRNDIAETDSLPTEIDSAQFDAGETDLGTQTTIDLNGEHSVAAAEFLGSFELKNGELQIGSGEITSDSLTVAADATISSTNELQFSGALTLQGSVGDLQLSEGNVAGHGRANSITIGPQATLQGLLDADWESISPLVVDESITVNGTFEIVQTDTTYQDPSVRGEQHTIQLFTATSINEDVQEVLYRNQPMTKTDAQSVYELLENDGLFRRVIFNESNIMLVNFLAEPGDTNGDGNIDFADFLILSTEFGQPGGWRSGDTDGNGIIEFADFLILSTRFGAVAAANVPEPNTNALLACSLLLVGLSVIRRPNVAATV